MGPRVGKKKSYPHLSIPPPRPSAPAFPRAPPAPSAASRSRAAGQLPPNARATARPPTAPAGLLGKRRALPAGRRRRGRQRGPTRPPAGRRGKPGAPAPAASRAPTRPARLSCARLQQLAAQLHCPIAIPPLVSTSFSHSIPRDHDSLISSQSHLMETRYVY